MTHRASQIIDAVVTALRASTTLGVPAANIFPYRTLSLADGHGELPAITVNVGEDSPAPDTGHFQTVGSQLDVITTAYVAGTSDEEVMRLAFAVRTEIHKALVVNTTFGLSFVLQLTYGGAAAPAKDSNSEMHFCAYEQRWQVVYWMSESDPS